MKHGDEWGDPETCEQGDYCSYCHTRTEQQFHPEVRFSNYSQLELIYLVSHYRFINRQSATIWCNTAIALVVHSVHLPILKVNTDCENQHNVEIPAYTEDFIGEMKTDRESAMRAYGTTLATLVNSELDKNGSAVQQQLSPPGRQRRSSESILTGNSQSTGTRVNFTTTEEDLEGDEMLETGGIAIPTGSQFSMISASAPGMFGRMRKFSSGLGQTGSPVTILRTPSGGDNGGVGSPSYSVGLNSCGILIREIPIFILF